MKQDAILIRARLKTPRAAAIAGILFSLLLITGLSLFRLSVRADPLETGAWLKTNSNKVALASNLVPFAGIADKPGTNKLLIDVKSVCARWLLPSQHEERLKVQFGLGGTNR
jgi:hypothetical protein